MGCGRVRLVPEQEIGCAWSEVYEGTEYGIVLILQSELEFHYLNPPEGIGRIDFRKTTEAGTLQHLDEIPTPVAQHSLDALPYVSWLEKNWPWVVGVGAATAAAFALYKATKRG